MNYGIGLFEKGETLQYKTMKDAMNALKERIESYPNYHWVVSNDLEFIDETMNGKDDDYSSDDDLTYQQLFKILTENMKMTSNEALQCLANSKANFQHDHKEFAMWCEDVAKYHEV